MSTSGVRATEDNRVSYSPGIDQNNDLPSSPLQNASLLAGLAPSQMRDCVELKLRNNLAPIHVKLPREILMNVFRHIAPSYSADIRFTHVCRLWRHLIHCTPEFWADMLNSDNIRWCRGYGSEASLVLTSYIRRSSPLPYKMPIRSIGMEMIRAISPHERRISFFSLVFSSICELTEFLALDMPFLETLFCCPRSHVAGENIAPRTGAFPRLHTLKVTRPFTFPADVFPALRTLEVFNPEDHTEPFFDLLEACPRLQKLSLRQSDYPPNHTDETDLDGRPAVFLPSLQCCHIVDAVYERRNFRWLSIFLQKVRFLPTAQLQVHSPWAHAIRLSAFIPFSPLAPFIPILDALELRFTPLGQSRPGEWRLVVDGYRDSAQSLHVKMTDAKWNREARSTSGPSEILFDLARSFSHAPSISLARLDVKFGRGVSVVRNDWLLVLQALPTLRVLTVRIDSCNSLLNVLRKNVGLCPVLESLSIICNSGSGVHGALLTVVELRTREGQSLENLTFRGSEDTPLAAGRLERLRALVRNVVVS